MSSSLSKMFGKLGQIMGVCPCCGELFYLSEARPYLDGKRPKSELDGLRSAEWRLIRQEQALDEAEEELREVARKAGQRAAKKLLRKIDPVFSGAGYDPQDVKVIFSPVNYIVFDGLAERCPRRILLLAQPPQDRITEEIHTSIALAIHKGNIDFKTLHVDDGGQVHSR